MTFHKNLVGYSYQVFSCPYLILIDINLQIRFLVVILQN